MAIDLIPLFEHTAEQQRHTAGKEIFRTGDPAESMYVVLEGQVELRVAGHHVCTAGPGEFFGEMALINHQPRSATAVAVTDCRLATVSERRFLFLLEQAPDFALHLMRVLVDRLQRTPLAA